MKTFSRCVVFALLITAASCAASGEQRVPLPAQNVTVTNANVTRIYFVREDTVGMQIQAVRVWDGDKEIGALGPDTYLCWERAGGRTVGTAHYEAKDPSRAKHEGLADLNCEAGRAYYFNVTVSSEDGRPTIKALDPEEGKRLVAKRKPAAGQ